MPKLFTLLDSSSIIITYACFYRVETSDWFATMLVRQAPGSAKAVPKAFGVGACHNLHRTKFFNVNKLLNKLHDLCNYDQIKVCL